MYFIWPPIQIGINSVGNVVLNSGYIGTWVYGFMERLLIPFGLHHVFYIPFWQTAVGGTMEVEGVLLKVPKTFSLHSWRFRSNSFCSFGYKIYVRKFPLMIFGLPGQLLPCIARHSPEKENLYMDFYFQQH